MAILTIAVVNHNTRELLRECLLSIRRHAPNDVEVVVVDNGSTDGSPEVVRSEFPFVHLIVNTQNLGFAKAVNQALVIGNGDYFLILNADVQLTEGAAEKLIAYMEAHPDVGIAAPANVTPDGEPTLTVHRDVTLVRELLRNLLLTDVWRYRVCGRHLARRIVSPISVDWATGSALMVRREVLKTVGGMDETVFLYGEEYDWQLRVRRAGWEVHFVPQAVVIHHKSASADQVLNVRRYRLVTRSTCYFFVKHHGWWGLPVLMFAHAVGSSLRMVLAGLLCVLGRKPICYQFREHALVVQDILSLGLYNWVSQAASGARAQME